MGSASSKYSSQHYDYRPFTGPVIPPPSQMAHGNSYTSGSTLPSYDMPRRKRRKWYQFGAGRDRHRGQDVWYSAYVSPPRGQQLATPNPFCQFSLFSPPLHLEKLISKHASGPGRPATQNSGFPETSRSSAGPFDASAGHGAIRKPSYP